MTEELRFYSQYDEEIFLFSIMSKVGYEPTQPPVQWVPEAISLGYSGMVGLYFHSSICHGMVLT
jgi:hypothetical protein